MTYFGGGYHVSKHVPFQEQRAQLQTRDEPHDGYWGVSAGALL